MTGSRLRTTVLALLVLSTTLVLLATVGTADTHQAQNPNQPFVIGYDDMGINPYHEEFRAPNWTAHPSTYIDGYPQSAEPINLTLDADTFDEAWQADQDVWNSLETDQLYYIPGTRIVGVIDGEIDFRESPAPNYDHNGHGTLVASAGSGNTLGTAPHSAIVMTSGMNGVPWVNNQPWIDILSLSKVPLAGVGLPSFAMQTHEFTESGRSLFAGGGNDPVRAGPTTITHDYTGPPWSVTVGLHYADENPIPTGQFCQACHVPADLLGTSGVAVAQTDSINETRRGGGTSTATPRVAGHAANLIDAARQELHDVSRPGFETVDAYARANPTTELSERGPLADGSFNRTELEELLRQTSIPAPIETHPLDLSGSSEPNPRNVDLPPNARYTWQGYGVHNFTANSHATAILTGDADWPSRPVDDRWHRFWQDTRSAYWATTLCQDGEFRGSYNGNCWTDPTLDLAASTQALVSGGLDRATR